MTHTTDRMDFVDREGLLLPGLDGANPLGFLAALGLLRVLSTVVNSTTMSWCETAGTWRPMIHGLATSAAELPPLVIMGLQHISSDAWKLNARFPFQAMVLQAATIDAIRMPNSSTRSTIDLLSGFGVSAFCDKDGNFEGTALQMVRSGDSQGNGLSGYAAKLIAETTEDQLHSALFGIWKFNESGCALRWSPEENVGYALQWDNPSGKPATSVRGANRLAIEAMGILSVIPIKREVRTAAFSGRRQKFLTWPIWTVPVSLNVVRSLINMAEIHSSEVDPTVVTPRGIAAVFRCERIKTSTYYHNFSPAQRIA